MRSRPVILSLLSLSIMALAAGTASAQNVPFQLLLTLGTSSATAANDSNIAFPSTEVNQISSVKLQATYTGNGTVNVPQGPQILGASTFTATLTGTAPLTLHPGDSVTVTMSYKPTSASGATAQMQLTYTETLPSSTTGQPVTTQNAIIFILVGTSPSFQLSYVLASTPNNIPLQSGGTLQFPGTLINTTASANLDISNIGSGSGQITSISQPKGPAFVLTGRPLLPATIPASQTLPLVISYTPTAAQTDTDQVQITLASGAVLSVVLQGSGITSTFTYQTVQGGVGTPVTAPGPIAMPDTNVGSTSSLIIQVQNTGNATGTISAPPTVGGQGFSISDGPLFPQVLTAGGSFTFTLNFTPTQAGSVKGTLIVGSALFTLTGNGLGSTFTYSYISSAGTISLGNPLTVVFSPATVTQNEKITFVVTNSGTLPGTISSIAVGESNSAYSLSGLPPALPVTLAAGDTLEFVITFAPTATGFSNGTLHIDTTVIALTGSGNPPPPLPAYTIQGPSGTAQPQTQPGVRLTLASSYPVDVVGTLTLSVSGTLPADPTVLFSTGSKTVAFTIPANTTNANFAGQGSTILFQTGTVASSITLTPSFSTATGGISLTPSSPTTLQFSVASAAPVLLAVTVSGQTSNSFSVNVIGYSTTRILNSVALQFTAASGFNLANALSTTIDIHQVGAVWYQSTTSQAFGGQFEITIPFTLTGTVGTGQTLLQALTSVSATVANDVGTSNSLQALIQ